MAWRRDRQVETVRQFVEDSFQVLCCGHMHSSEFNRGLTILSNPYQRPGVAAGFGVALAPGGFSMGVVPRIARMRTFGSFRIMNDSSRSARPGRRSLPRGPAPAGAIGPAPGPRP